MSTVNENFPTFSIITITLNNFEGLKKTEKSIDTQTYENFEWIVIDGNSTDNTLDHLKNRRTNTRRDKNPFKFISEADEGLYDAMNTGIEQARGHYIVFLNAGDELAATETLSLIAPHTEKKPDFIFGDALEPINGNKTTYKKARRYKDIAWGMITHHQAMFYRRHTIRDFKMRYSLIYEIASDYDFTARFLLKAKKIAYLPKPICIFEQGGVSQRNAALGRKEQFIIRQNLEMVQPTLNLWVLIVQSSAWRLKSAWPSGYRMLKSLFTKS